MLRTSKVTFTASAVTLVCLAGTLYASPVVVAEHMGREIAAYSPMEHQLFTNDRAQSTIQANDAGTPREATTVTNDGTWETVESEMAPTATSNHPTDGSTSIGTAATAPDDTDDDATSEPTDSATSRITSEVPRIGATPTESPAESPTDENSAAADEPAEAADDTAPEDVDSPDAITVIVNKLRALPADFVPDDLVEVSDDFTDGTKQQLREEAAKAAENLFAAAEHDGIDLHVVSSFRSYDYQQRLYDNYQQQYGADNTDAMSARPGYSEHQTGLALDVDTPGGQHTLKTSFGETDAGQWLADHAHEYGFVIRYPEGQHDVTGFQYEPWHLRYFGEQYARQIVENSGVAEEEFGLEPAPDYEEYASR